MSWDGAGSRPTDVHQVEKSTAAVELPPGPTRVNVHIHGSEVIATDMAGQPIAPPWDYKQVLQEGRRDRHETETEQQTKGEKPRGQVAG